MDSPSSISNKQLPGCCKHCGYEYTFPADTFNFKRMTCPECGSRLMIRTGNVVKAIQEFHTARTNSENPADWQLGDFAEVILSSGRARAFDIIPFMQALIQLPEWQDIDFMDSKRRKEADLSVPSCLNTITPAELPYQLSVIFNRLVGVFRIADQYGFCHLSSYITHLKEGSSPKNKRSSHPGKVNDEDFVYEGMVNDEGKAVGLDVPLTIRGKRFILTGSFDKKRAYYEKDIIAAGGFISTTVSNSDYLIIGMPGREKISRKAKEAQRYGILAVSLNSLKKALSMDAGV
jgi:DNA-directed RNA polymerase subunit RPC12/RpoP